MTLSVRPECWKLAEQGSDLNSVEGRIGDSVYLGEVAQYEFVAGEQKLKIYELNPRHVNAGGDRVLHATVESQDVVVLTG